MKIWVVVDVYNGWAIKAFHGENAEEKAKDFANKYYLKTGFGCRYDEIYLTEA